MENSEWKNIAVLQSFSRLDNSEEEFWLVLIKKRKERKRKVPEGGGGILGEMSSVGSSLVDWRDEAQRSISLFLIAKSTENSSGNEMQAKKTENLITKTKKVQDRVHFQFSMNKIIAIFLLKLKRKMKFCWIF